MSEVKTVSAFYPGFNDPVMDSQRVFRTILEALSRPGMIREVPGAPEAPQPLYTSTAALALALFDLDTPLWLDDSLNQPDIRDYFSFHCGTPLVGDPARAAFGLFGQGLAYAGLDMFNPGQADYPDRSATLLIQVDGFSIAQGVTLTGPGINGQTTLSVRGLADRFWSDFKANYERFPQGVDCFLVSPTAVCGLPRSTRVKE